MSEALLNLFNIYGWPGLAAAIGILILTYFINKNQKKSDKKISDGFSKLSDSMMEQNKQLISAITESNKETQSNLFNIINTTIVKNDKLKKEQHDEAFAYRMDISDEINDYIKEINDVYHANRTMLIEFHNSKENLNGLPFAWYDVSFERQSRDTVTLQQKCKNMQIQNIICVIRDIKDNNNNIVHYNSEDIENLYDRSSVLYAQLKEINVTDIIYSGLYNKYNVLIGILVIEYNSKHPYYKENVSYDDINTRSEQLSTMLRFKSNNI